MYNPTEEDVNALILPTEEAKEQLLALYRKWQDVSPKIYYARDYYDKLHHMSKNNEVLINHEKPFYTEEELKEQPFDFFEFFLDNLPNDTVRLKYMMTVISIGYVYVN